MSPWLFFLTSVSVGAGLAALVVVATAAPDGWNWGLYRHLFIVALTQDLIIVPCGFAAAWLLVQQQVSAESLLHAFAYASAWRPLSMPALVYILASMERQSGSTLLFKASIVTILIYNIYLIIGMAAHSFMEGRARLSFGILTVLFVCLIQVAVVFALVVPPNARESLLISIHERLTGADAEVFHCDNAIIHGSVMARGGDALIWFEWGDTPNLGRRTPPRRYLDDGTAFEPLVDLRENTRYYYRIALHSAHGVSHGELVSFVTSDCSEPVTGGPVDP